MSTATSLNGVIVMGSSNLGQFAKNIPSVIATDPHRPLFAKRRVWKRIMSSFTFSGGVARFPSVAPVTVEHYNKFLRLNNRKKTQSSSDLSDAGYPSVTIPNYDTRNEAVEWCRSNFSHDVFIAFQTMFFFAKEEDAIHFKMRWV